MAYSAPAYSAAVSASRFGKAKSIFQNAVLLNVMILIIFSVIYAIYLNVKPEHWNLPAVGHNDTGVVEKYYNGLYAGTIFHTTVGFGDFFPTHLLSKMLVVGHILMVFFLNMIL